MAVSAAEMVFDTRRRVKELFDLDAEEQVIFTDGCTTALNTVIKGVLKPGDHVVISSYEHNAVVRPLEKMRAAGMITYSVAHPADNDEETIESFRSQINRSTRLFICTHASNVTGRIMPIRRLCALAHSYGILFCVDAAQSAGVLPISAKDDGYDFVCCAGHKGLYGPMGVGLLLMNHDVRLDTLTEGGTGSASDSPLMPEEYPERMESGTLNVPGIAGLNAGVRYVQSRGCDTLYRRELKEVGYLYQRLSENPNVILYTPMPKEGLFAPVLSFNIRDIDSESVARILDRRYGIAVRAGLHCAPSAHRILGTLDCGTVRVAPSSFTTRDNMRYLASTVYKISHSHQ